MLGSDAAIGGSDREATAMDTASDPESAVDAVPPPPKKKGFLGKRKRNRQWSNRRGEWKQQGCKRVSEKRATEKAERQKKRVMTTKTKLDQERQSHKATLKTSRAKDKTIRTLTISLSERDMKIAALKADNKRGNAGLADLAKHQAKCAKQHIDVGKLPTVPYEDATPRGQAARRAKLTQVVKVAAEKLMFRELSPKETELLTSFWKETYKPPPDPLSEEEREPEPDPPDPEPEKAWRKKWERLFRLRGIADHEGAVSSTAMRKILMAC